MPTTTTYDAANELSTSNAFSVGVTTYTSDANGNLLTSLNPSGQRTTNTWEFENRLTQVALPSAIVDTFTYNGDGQRVQKIDSTGTSNHVWDGQNILLETNASNIIQVVYTLQPDLYGNLISQWRSGIGSFYLFDGLGSTTQLANSTGSVSDSYLYDSWGNILLMSGTTANWFGYVGQLGYYYGADMTKYYLRARFYDPTVGRFPCPEQPHPGMSPNLYRYVSNRTPNFSDPSGLFDLWLGWEYGNYCGSHKVGRDPNDPTKKLPPIDPLDAACLRHDLCQATRWTCNPFHIYVCSKRLCQDAMNAYYFGCKTSSTYAECTVAALQVMALFCLVSGLPLVPQPAPPALP